ncbi:MAG: hypothetical protein ABSC31_15065 [Acidimicrobiales bacterium]
MTPTQGHAPPVNKFPPWTLGELGVAVESERALRRIVLSQSEAIRAALLGEVRYLRRSKELAAEVALLEADAADREEMLAVAELMEALRAPR